MTRNRTVDTREQTIGQDKSILLSNEVDADDIRDAFNDNMQPDTPAFKDHADNLAFMEELVQVRVHETTEKNAEKVVDVYCNGIPQRFIRGVPIVVKRKYVEVLARAKPFTVTTPEIVDATGSRTTKIETSSALRYPFDMQDRNPDGQRWLQSILLEA